MMNNVNIMYSLSGKTLFTLTSLYGSVGLWFVCLALCGCITKYEPTGIDEVSDILVVEGIITDDETTITLSRSINLTGEYWGSSSSYNQYAVSDVSNAKVYVECEDGTLWQAAPPIPNTSYDYYIGMGSQFTIKTGTLNPDNKYRLKIEIEEVDYGSDDCYPNLLGEITCPTKTYEYCSAYSHPIKTPEIDSIFWIKKGRGQPVLIHVATHSPDHQVMYYCWSYKEDWEINANFMMDGYPYYCWNKSSSSDLLIGSAERTVFGQLTDKITEISPSNNRLSVLYRINVKQNAISKRAYDYFENIKKNSQQIGSLFAPTPSELRGNITCTTYPDRAVIGYVDISATTQMTTYIPHRNDLYEPPRWQCDLTPLDSLILWYPPREGAEWELPDFYIEYDTLAKKYILIQCVDCTLNQGTTQKPDNWPNNH